MKNRIRRFDIFAIMNFLKNQNTMSEEKAKGEAIWLAKLVANRKLYGGGRKAKADTEAKSKSGKVQMWKSLSGIPQTDLEYDKAIVERFGEDYPAVEAFVKDKLSQGFDYKLFRDCEHATGGRNTGYCKACSEKLVAEYHKQIKTEQLKLAL